MKKIDLSQLAMNQSAANLVKTYETLGRLMDMVSRDVDASNRDFQDKQLLHFIKLELALNFDTRYTKKSQEETKK